MQITFPNTIDKEHQPTLLEQHSYLIAYLSEYLDEVKIEAQDEMYLKFKTQSYDKKDLYKIIEIMASICVDEIDIEGEYIRLWWD
ncbi:MAG: hypothetical protein J7J61_09165 [Candidatus Hydrothermae bacterium]|nr:hypothetical protein [Candidatus Hydrothermae bacterium]